MKKFPFFLQLESMDCGPSCLRIIAEYYGKSYSSSSLRELTGISKEGVSLFGISEAAERIGFRTIAIKTSWQRLTEENPVPFVAHWRKNHFVVVYKINNQTVFISDPAIGLTSYSKKEFLERWLSTSNETESFGVALLFETTPAFYQKTNDKQQILGFRQLFKHLLKYKGLLFQLLLGLLIGSLIQLIFPFLTQAVVDIGIKTGDIKFIYIILSAQLMLFLSQTAVDFIRGWILLHMNTRINISLLVDFLTKLMKLPISFFESKMTGDIIQRMTDQQRIQNFLTGPALNILFSIFNFIIFSIVIILYNSNIFFIFFLGSILYMCWVLFFMGYRKKIDYKRFEMLSQNQSNIIELIQGMQEIKMNTCETQKRWEWENIQAKVFKINVKSLELTQYQQGGAIFINQVKNIFITIFSATAVVKGDITFGAMLAIQYMVGQLNGPIEQFINFTQSIQDASISMERMNDIHHLQDEEPEHEIKIIALPSVQNLQLKNVCFKYNLLDEENTLKNITLFIPYGKITALVGESGSGKTTLLKILMKFYSPTSGKIEIGTYDLNDISNKIWRGQCGVVMQDNYIFSDSIARNIAVGDDNPDMNKLMHAVKIANIIEHIKSLPLGFNTKIGAEGSGLSQGQRQRILIARAVYKNPNFIFFDEATNALDANNEMIIMDNLSSFFNGKTVVIAAHRLSTIRNADQIVVIDKGKLIERGTHQELVSLQGAYFTLFKNQLELSH